MLFCTGGSATFCLKLGGMKNPQLNQNFAVKLASASHILMSSECAHPVDHCICAHQVDHCMCSTSDPLDVCICITTTCKHPRAHLKSYIRWSTGGNPDATTFGGPPDGQVACEALCCKRAHHSKHMLRKQDCVKFCGRILHDRVFLKSTLLIKKSRFRPTVGGVSNKQHLLLIKDLVLSY